MSGLQNGSAPQTNGVVPNELEALCHDLKAKVDTFLDTPTEDEVLNSVKNQIIIARGVIDEALRRYRCFSLSLFSSSALSPTYPLRIPILPRDTVSLALHG